MARCSDEDASQLMAAFKRGRGKPKRKAVTEDNDDAASLMAAFKSNTQTKRQSNRAPEVQPERPVQVADTTEDESSTYEDAPEEPSRQPPARKAPVKPQRLVCVRVPPVRNRQQYVYYEPKASVEKIIREFSKKGVIMYEVEVQGDGTQVVSFDDLLQLPNGLDALNKFSGSDRGSDLESGTDDEMQLRNKTRKARNPGYVDITGLDLSSSANDEDMSSDPSQSTRTRGRPPKNRKGKLRQSRLIRGRGKTASSSEEEEESDSDDGKRKRKRRRKGVAAPTRRSAREVMPVRRMGYDTEEDQDDDDDGSSGSDILRSDLFPRKSKRNGHTSDKHTISGLRQSGRATRATNNMEDGDEDEMYRSDSAPKAQKMVVVREAFPPLARNDLFRSRHGDGCEVCWKSSDIAPLVYCQGCSGAYHKNCLGNRSTRDHLVTKVGDEHFVLQCKRCINFYRKKDSSAPDLARCQDCTQPGASCSPFRQRQTTQQEMKEREDNNGEDPIVDVRGDLINNVHNVLFRCTKCSRAWHFHHLPALSPYAMDVNRDEEELADERFREYSKNWRCKECDDMGDKKPGSIIAWRPSDVETYRTGTPCYRVSEDAKQYLIKWEGQSYFRAAWFSGAWTWGVTAAAMRKAFFKREDGPKMRTEDAIPEEYLRIDIVLSIKFTSYVDVRSEEIDKARIKEVDKALIKYKGLGYEDAVWETVPTSDEGERWLDFVSAYNDWVAGRYIRYPKQGPLKARIEKARNTAFKKLEREKQPENLVGGELMKYQIDGLNWLYYQWYSQKNGILADEMGLGKTIQVIAFMATLVQEHHCWPFLIVVPNSTCPNWRREIKQWAPSLRVVAYYGSAQARDMAYKHELFPEGAKELRCHVVVTSYEAASDDSCRRFFRSVSWAGLIVDEGQRLKNDKSQLYTALNAVKAPYRVLLTGTPLQNNARELFNLLHFLDDSIDPEELEEQYAEMTSEKVRTLHEQIRPFILRRTKVQVLTFLPPLGQVILPITMSHLQKQVYKSILSKNPELLKALFTSNKSLKQQERSNLSNILMQLRKCLCHPFVYSQEIEERTDVAAVSHRNLVEASAKLSLLEMLLPKLQERGHRVLIFSQFLDMLNIIEDFLDGMQMAYQRLDGNIGSLEKQKRIDQFNAPDSPLFAFLLSTRAGGVGINLATADTVIILDPDWNPHQDIQAIARAHRIGQKKKVLCLQLVTRNSVEEKIMQMGRKKMALDVAVVGQLDTDDIEDEDVEAVLKFGAAELFKDDDGSTDIRYDEASVEKLLDRSQIENTKTSDDNSAESQFSFARIWANDKGGLQDDFDTVDEEIAPDPGVWDKILQERKAAAAAEALARAEAMGRGRRAKLAVDYANNKDHLEESASVAGDDGDEDVNAALLTKEKKRKRKDYSESDTDFHAETDEESEPEEALFDGDVDAAKELGENHRNPSKPIAAQYQPGGTPARNGAISKFKVESTKFTGGATIPGVSFPIRNNQPAPAPQAPPSNQKRSEPQPRIKREPTVAPFQRAVLPVKSETEPAYISAKIQVCPACQKTHPQGACELKIAGEEHCGLCGMAHYGYARTCPHVRSETQVRTMLEALKSSPEKKELVEAAIKYLRGVKGHLVQQKKRDREKAEALKNGGQVPPSVNTQYPRTQQGNTYIPPHPGGQVPSYPSSRPNQPPPGYVSYAQSRGQNGGPSQAQPGAPPAANKQAAPGSVGSYIDTHNQFAQARQQQALSQAQARSQAHAQAQGGFDEQATEQALRGFLGR